jgi:hypothetical protein
MIVDDLRRAYPHLGISIFAMEPLGAVTLEVYSPDGQIFPFVGATVQETLERAFPLYFEPKTEPEVGIPTAQPNAFD